MAEFKATLNPLAEARIPQDSLHKTIKIDGPLDFAASTTASSRPWPGRPSASETQALVHGRQRRGHQRARVSKQAPEFLARQNAGLEPSAGQSGLRHILHAAAGQPGLLADDVGIPGEQKTNLSIEDLKI